jgi:hypothetical protein
MFGASMGLAIRASGVCDAWCCAIVTLMQIMIFAVSWNQTATFAFGNFWPEVPETPHIGAHPRTSTAATQIVLSRSLLQIGQFSHGSRPKPV